VKPGVHLARARWIPGFILVAFGSPSCGGGQAELAMGAGHVMQTTGLGESDTEVLAGVCGPTPTDAGRLQDEVDLDSVRADLAGVVTSTLEPAHLSVWLGERN
jgi:hypothetical protein